jgi:hypothetical protein
MLAVSIDDRVVSDLDRMAERHAPTGVLGSLLPGLVVAIDDLSSGVADVA